MRWATWILVVATGCNWAFGLDETKGTGVIPAIKFLQVAAADINTSAVQPLPFDQPVTAHDTVIACLDYDGPGTAAVSDSLGNSYQAVLGPIDAPTGPHLYVFAAFDIAGGADIVTFTLSAPPTTYFEIYAHEVTNVAAYDTGSSASGTTSASDAMASGPVDTHFANELLFGFGITGTATAGTNFTTLSIHDKNITEDRVVDAVGSYQATATMAAGTAWTMLLAAFAGS